MKKMRLLRKYTGGGIRNLYPGEYRPNDPRLQGRADYLVSIEVAEWFDDHDLKAKKPAMVTVEYVGGNTKAHDVRVDGEPYAVPEKQDGAEGIPLPRLVSVPEAVARVLLDRPTFRAVGKKGR